jgi:hypothetical protein
MLVVTTDATTRTLTTTGCPHYDWTSQTTPEDALVIDRTYVVPLEPTLCTNVVTYVGVYTDLTLTTTNTASVLDAIGVAFNGVPIFGNADVDNQDAYVSEGYTFNQCNGHPSFDGQYHYHSQVPDECLFEMPIPNAHSDLFAFMADGIPLYGPLGDGGVVPLDLDECNGHVDTTNPFYHYHVADSYEYPYTVNCLKGVIDVTLWDSFETLDDCIESPVQYDYSSLIDVWKDIDLDLTEGPTSAPTSAPAGGLLGVPGVRKITETNLLQQLYSVTLEFDGHS